MLLKAGLRWGARAARAWAGGWGLGWEGARREGPLGRVAVLDFVRAWVGWRVVGGGWARVDCEGGRREGAPERTVVDRVRAWPAPVPALGLAPASADGAACVLVLAVSDGPPACVRALAPASTGGCPAVPDLPRPSLPCAALTVRDEGGGYLAPSRVDGALAMPVRAPGFAGPAAVAVRWGGLTGRRLGERVRGSGSSGLWSGGLRRERERYIVRCGEGGFKDPGRFLAGFRFRRLSGWCPFPDDAAAMGLVFLSRAREMK